MKYTIHHGSDKPIYATGKNQVKLLSFAFEYRGWHTFASDRATTRAVRALENKGCLEVLGAQFRFVFPSSF